MYNSIRLAGIVLAATTAVGCASIPETTGALPDYSADPTYRTLNLNADFSPDPVSSSSSPAATSRPRTSPPHAPAISPRRPTCG